MRFLLASVAFFLSACTTTSIAPTQYYRATGQTGQIAITGTLKQQPGFFSRDMKNDVEILINGKRITGGTFTGGAIELSGTFDGKPVIADCSAISSGAIPWGSTNPTNVRCLVFIAGDRAASLLLAP